MGSNVSSEKPKSVSLRSVAEAIRATRAEGKKVLLVGGPAIVHTGSAAHVARLIRDGWVQTLFAGNALATHDIEQALFGTSLGVSIDAAARRSSTATSTTSGPSTRSAGSAGSRAAVEAGVLTSGIMYECVKPGVDLVLAGSIRDDGPLPEVITDTLEAQDRMREAIRGVGFALLIATALHSIATGNLLPAWVKVVCVDINPATVTKLSDRGTFQTIGLVTDVEPFLRSPGRASWLRRRPSGAITSSRSRTGTMEPVEQDPANPDVPARLLRDRVRDQSLDEPSRSGATRAESRRQWQALHETLVDLGVDGRADRAGAGPARPRLHGQRGPGLPRPVHQLAVPVRRPPGGDARISSAWARDARVRRSCRCPEAMNFEGAGDALFCGETLFAGYRFRSDVRSHQWVGERLGVEVLPLELVDPRFYHLDTCFCPLAPDARRSTTPAPSTTTAARCSRDRIPRLIEVSAEEAISFSCNAVVVGRTVVLNAGGAEARRGALRRLGLRGPPARLHRVHQVGRQRQVPDPADRRRGGGGLEIRP